MNTKQLDTTLSDHRAEQVRLGGLQRPAQIIRDQWGIPHVRAESSHDAFLLNGFVHAQDRMWQMEAALRRATGRFAEMAGPQALPADQLARRLGSEKASRRDYAALNAESRAMLEAYSEGVNAWIDGGNSTAEHDLLGMTPMRWEPWFSVAVMRQRGILMGSVWFKLWRAAAFGTIGANLVPLLRYDDGGTEDFVLPQGASGKRWVADLEALRPSIDALTGTAQEDGMVGGSNNWAVSGTRTASGSPMVAGDPHRQYEVPGIYTQLHLTCPEFDAIGFAVPGVPAFPHFCHTRNVAWCVTHAFADIHDVYIEQFRKDGAEYRTADGHKESEIRLETIMVRGAESITITVAETEHGPIIAGDPADGQALALKSVQLFDTDVSFNCLLPMLKATNLTDFYDAGRAWGVIDHSVVGADRDGHIGCLVRAIVPERDRINGWLPVPGWSGEHEWRGMIPFERMPREMDPDRGFIVTANNRLVDADHPDYLLTDCHPSTRASRVAKRIERTADLTPGDMMEILRDTDSEPAREITTRILGSGATEGAALRATLAGWDGRMDAGLTAPTIYYAIRQEMTRLLGQMSGLSDIAKHPAISPTPGVSPLAQLWWTLPNLLRTDDTSLLGGRDWNSIIREALKKVADGPTPAPWGAAHLPVMIHPLSHLFPDAPGVAAPVSHPTSGDGDCVLATGALPATGARSIYGPVARYVFDLADWDNSRWIVLHGASGAAGHAHYQDQNALWAQGDMVPMPYSRAAVDAHAASVTMYTQASA